MRQLDIVLPCYNPLPHWAENIVQHIAELNQKLTGTEIFVYLINDRSTQGILSTHINYLKAFLPNFTYLDYAENQGKGYALRQGVELANHDICIFTDVDFPYQTESFLQLYEALKQGETDIAVGVRDQHYYQGMQGAREPLSKILKFLNNKIFHLTINDTQGGLKGFNQKGRKVFLETKTNRYLFDLEFIFQASNDSTLKVKAVPVKLRPNITFRKFNTRILLSESSSFIKLFLQKYIRF